MFISELVGCSSSLASANSSATCSDELQGPVANGPLRMQRPECAHDAKYQQPNSTQQSCCWQSSNCRRQLHQSCSPCLSTPRTGMGGTSTQLQRPPKLTAQLPSGLSWPMSSTSKHVSRWRQHSTLLQHCCQEHHCKRLHAVNTCSGSIFATSNSEGRMPQG